MRIDRVVPGVRGGVRVVVLRHPAAWLSSPRQPAAIATFLQGLIVETAETA